MAGIAAIFRTDGRGDARAVVERMTRAMAYRGPDGLSHWDNGLVALGHCRMDTTAEALEESQPTVSEDGKLALVMDGYLTNWEELRRHLLSRGARLRNRSDAELVLHAYDQWGEECSRHIDGEYAFVIWDARRRQLFCSRDHMGLRPLMYHWDGQQLIVATEVAALLAAMPSTPDVDRQMLAEVMGSEWLSLDRTAWKGIMRLLPAHSMICTGGQLTAHKYWKIPSGVTISYRNDQEYAEHYLQMLKECVSSAARTHLPLACEVSGGLDSTAIFSLAHELAGRGALPAPDLRGYTFAAPVGSAADEMGYVRDLAKMLGVEIMPVELFMPPLDWYAKQVAQDRDLATYANTSMLIGIGQRLAQDGCRVALNGQGGDQWLTGSIYYYREALAAGDLKTFCAALREDGAAYGISRAVKSAVRSVISPLIPASLSWIKKPFREMRYLSLTAEREQLHWIAPDLRADLVERREVYRRSLADHLRAHPGARNQHPFELRFFDSFSRQCARLGYESRSPMMSRPYVEFCAGLPQRQKLRAGVHKFVHRQALAGRLPETIRTRTTKAEFSVVYEQRAEEITKLLRGPVLQDHHGLIDPAGLERLADTFANAPIDSAVTWEVMGALSSFWFATNATGG